MQEPFIGSIQYFAFNFAPVGWQQCQGQTLAINQYQALFALLGTTYGGNGTSNFMLPDLRGRSILGQGRSTTGSNYVMGQKAGVENYTMLASNMPVHTHGVATAPKISASTTASQGTPGGNYPAPAEDGNSFSNAAASPAQYLGAPTLSVSVTGSSAPISLHSPYLALTCAIAINGIFPSRN